MHIGCCLCGQVTFNIYQKIQTIYHCHCSLCRKQSGTSSNAATLVHQQNFKWECSKNSIHTYKKSSGFTSSFCNRCGSPVPNQVGKTDFMWIPLGLLEQNIEPTQRLNFCMSSSVDWNPILQAEESYEELPQSEVLMAYFK